MAGTSQSGFQVGRRKPVIEGAPARELLSGSPGAGYGRDRQFTFDAGSGRPISLILLHATARLNLKPLRPRNGTNPISLYTVALTRSLSSRRSTRLALMWLIAAVLSLQSMAVGGFTALGPSHIHKAPLSVLVLEDVRRWKPSPVRESLPALFGYSHASASAQRHYHAFDDSTVVKQSVDATANVSSVDDGMSAGSLLAPFWAMSSGTAAWQPLQATDALTSGPFWTATSAVVEPHERPPKRAA